MRNKLLLLIVGMFLLTFVSAEVQTLGIFKQGDDVILTQGCVNSTYSNISKVLYPNSSLAISTESIMTETNDFYNYTFTSTDTLGQYIVYGHCNPNGGDTQWAYDFEVTPTGEELTTSKLTLYVSLIVILSFFGVVLGMLLNIIPSSNSRDESTNMIKINYLKYTRPVIYGVIFLIIWAVLFIGNRLSSYYLTDQFIGNVLFVLMYVMNGIIIIALPIGLLKLIDNIINDKTLKRNLERGIDYD